MLNICQLLCEKNIETGTTICKTLGVLVCFRWQSILHYAVNQRQKAIIVGINNYSNYKSLLT